MDNFAIPRLWRGDFPQICGEPQVGGMYSNTGTGAEVYRWGCEGLREAFGRPSEAPPRCLFSPPKAFGSSAEEPPVVGRQAFRTTPDACLGRVAAGRKDEGRPCRKSGRDALGAVREVVAEAVPALCQPFLMRLVSSVTWL